MSKAPERNPWLWVPSLYFAEGVPYVVVMTVSIIMYKRMGLSNSAIALYTSWLYLPWVIKPFWSPLVDLLKTKRLWIISMQLTVALAMGAVALAIPLRAFLPATLAVFSVLALSSATHDIAADGFYMLGLREHEQAAFVGVRSMFYRLAMVAGQGLLVVLAGSLESSTSLPSEPLTVEVVSGALPRAAAPDDSSATRQARGLACLPSHVSLSLHGMPRDECDSILAYARSYNLEHGFVERQGTTQGDQTSLGFHHLVAPLESFLRAHFGEQTTEGTSRTGDIALVKVLLQGALASDESRPVTCELSAGEGSVRVAEGEHLRFSRANAKVPALLALQTDANQKLPARATLELRSGDISSAWAQTFLVLAVLFALLLLYHRWALPVPGADTRAGRLTPAEFSREFFRVFGVFFRKKNIVSIIAFLLLYRFAESQLVKMVSPFLLDPRDRGGLGLTTSEVGLVYGTVGIAALSCGGLLGGWIVSRQGLRSWLWPMVIIMHLPDLAFVYLAHAQPESPLLIGAAVALEQFGYGFGFTAYMLFMILVSDGEHRTAHYAICTGIMALGMMVPGMFSGWLQELIGYRHFYTWIILSTIPGFLVTALVKVDPAFGKKLS
ncbi:MAG TPA: MFS transporter [Bacteroidota bacterium]|nr:MFS transporter [Bacteroidota bacterium]